MANNKLLPHHAAWLKAHPTRSEEWLRDRLRDGFDVHHIDGDSRNDKDSNLVLIEASDHMMLHFVGRQLSRVRSNLVPRSERPTLAPKPDKAERDYVSEKTLRRRQRMGI